jgi:hypothetical protein
MIGQSQPDEVVLVYTMAKVALCKILQKMQDLNVSRINLFLNKSSISSQGAARTSFSIQQQKLDSPEFCLISRLTNQ